MHNLIKLKQPVFTPKLFLVGFILLLITASTQAGTVAQGPLFLTSTVKPNIMLMLDNSISMDDDVVVVPTGTVYNPTVTYPTGAGCSATALPANGDAYGTGTNCLNAGGVRAGPSGARICSITYGTSIPKSFYSRVTSSGTGTQCFSAGKTYATSLTFPAGVTTNAQKANWLNYYYQNEIAKLNTTTKTRLKIAKGAATSLINSLTSDVRLGLSTFNNDNGGKLWEPIDDLFATKKANLLKLIDDPALSDSNERIKADARTPLSETLADIGNYFSNVPSTCSGADCSKVTLHAGDTSTPSLEQSLNKTAVLPSSLIDSTGWSGRTAISGEPSFSKNPVQFRCQKSFVIHLTDGLPSSDRDISSNTYLKDYDGDCSGSKSSQCTGSHDMKKAYGYPGGNGGSPNLSVGAGNESSDYWDDVSLALFEMDLRPDLRVPDKEADGAKNNLTSYVIGFADDAINPTIPGVNPLPKDAAIQGGGKFFYAGSEGELTASLNRTIQFITEDLSSSSSVAANSTQFQTNALLFQAVFNSTDWSGDIRAFDLLSEDTNGNGKLDVPEDVNNNSTLDVGEDKNGNGFLDTLNEDTNGNGVFDSGRISSTIRWKAAEVIPDPDDRKILTYNPITDLGVNFFWNELNSAQKLALDSLNAAKSGKYDSPILNYLRGDRTKEGPLATEFRERSSTLGDIINSDPLFIGSQDFGYSTLPEGSGTKPYSAHLTHKQSNEEMLYVGANDGMLHAFQVGVNPSVGAEGQEVFAYIPNAVISGDPATASQATGLASLTQKSYTHRFFVDGAPQYGDVFFDNAWHTVLVGSMGAGSTPVTGGVNGTGGRAVFALDVTTPANFGANDVLWEFTNRHDVDLGYTLPSPSVARMANGSWVAIVGNGYNSDSGKAVLFIRDIKTGGHIRKIEVDISGGNGLSTPNPVDVDGDNIIDYIYAGDLKGNMWKFDVTSTDPNLWDVAFSGQPLFVALDNATPTPKRQPITAKPAVVKAAATEQTRGLMVFFGTGKYFEEGDHASDPQIQTFYGIWDRCDKTTPGCNETISGRSQLAEQKIVDEIDLTAIDRTVRLSTACEVAYGPSAPSTTSPLCSSATNRRGWYMDLKSPVKGAEGERAVNSPIVRRNVVVFTTLIPINATCEPGGTGWFMEIDITGARFISSPIDVNKDGKIDEDDLYQPGSGEPGFGISGSQSEDGIIENPTITKLDNGMEIKSFNTQKVVINQELECVPGEPCPPPEKDCTTDPTLCPPPPIMGRRSWRQLH